MSFPPFPYPLSNPTQVVLQFVDHSIGGRFVQRVTTRRLPVVASLGDYMRGINGDAACVVAAKKAVIDAKKSGALWQHSKADELRWGAQSLGANAAMPGASVQPFLVMERVVAARKGGRAQVVLLCGKECHLEIRVEC